MSTVVYFDGGPANGRQTDLADIELNDTVAILTEHRIQGVKYGYGKAIGLRLPTVRSLYVKTDVDTTEAFPHNVDVVYRFHATVS